MDGAKNGRAALNARVAKLIQKANNEENLGLTKENFAEKLSSIAEKLRKDGESENLKKFREGLENDLLTPVAMAAMQKESNGKSRPAVDCLADIFTMDKVLSLKVIENAFAELEKQTENSSKADDHAGDPEAAEITALVEERTAAKKAKDFAKADQIRNDLAARGITIIDTAQGPTWKRN